MAVVVEAVNSGGSGDNDDDDDDNDDLLHLTTVLLNDILVLNVKFLLHATFFFKSHLPRETL